jgi:hypothetical protein
MSTSKTPLMDIVNAAAERFDKRPEYRASVEARAELRATGTAHAQTSASTSTSTTSVEKKNG